MTSKALVGRCIPWKIRPDNPLRCTSSHAASIRVSSPALESPPALASVEAKSFEEKDPFQAKDSMLASSSTIKSWFIRIFPVVFRRRAFESPKRLLLNSGDPITSTIFAVIRTLDVLAFNNFDSSCHPQS